MGSIIFIGSMTIALWIIYYKVLQMQESKSSSFNEYLQYRLYSMEIEFAMDEKNSIAVEWRLQEQQRRREYDEAYRIWNIRHLIWIMKSSDIQSMPSEVKLSYLTDWIMYKIKWQESATKYDHFWGPMPFECFIANQLL